MVKSPDFGFYICHWTNYLACRNFIFLIYKIGLKVVDHFSSMLRP